MRWPIKDKYLGEFQEKKTEKNEKNIRRKIEKAEENQKKIRKKNLEKNRKIIRKKPSRKQLGSVSFPHPSPLEAEVQEYEFS